jgi:hypothetical protein
MHGAREFLLNRLAIDLINLLKPKCKAGAIQKDRAMIRVATKNQRPPGRRAAYLARQRLVAERAARKAERAEAPSATLRTPRPLGGESIVPMSIAAFRQAHSQFAAALARAEQSGPRWNGAARISWQTLASIASTETFAQGDRVSHEKFGSGTVTGVDQYRVWVWFDDVGAKCILDSFLVHQ